VALVGQAQFVLFGQPVVVFQEHSQQQILEIYKRINTE
jgi:hypothetical protein